MRADHANCHITKPFNCQDAAKCRRSPSDHASWIGWLLSTIQERERFGESLRPGGLVVDCAGCDYHSYPAGIDAGIMEETLKTTDVANQLGLARILRVAVRSSALVGADAKVDPLGPTPHPLRVSQNMRTVHVDRRALDEQPSKRARTHGGRVDGGKRTC